MAVRIVLLSPECDKAVVKKSNNHFIMTTNHGLDDKPLDEAAIENFTRLGYEPCGAVFWSEEAANKYLSIKYAACREKHGFQPPLHDELVTLIKYIEIDQANEYLNRIESELIPMGKYDISKELALALHEIGCVQTDSEVLARVDKILEICSNENI
jgi:hypothetical protein